MFRKNKQESNPRRQPAVRSGSGTVFSYYANRSSEPDTQVRSRDAVQARGKAVNRQWLRNLPSIIAIVAVVISVLYALGLDNTPTVIMAGATEQTPIPLRTKEEYQRGASEILKNSVFNRSKPTIDTSKVADEFTTKFPEVSDVSVSLSLLGRRPVMILETAQPALLLSGSGDTLVLDNRGKAVMVSSGLNSAISDKLPTVDDQTGAPAEVGKTVLSSDDVQFITSVVSQLKAKGISAENITLPPLARELHVKIAGKPYYVKFNMSTDARVAVGGFIASKQKLEADRVKPAEYFDARIEERVYYK